MKRAAARSWITGNGEEHMTQRTNTEAIASWATIRASVT
jgi:hypothetical protein